MHAKLDRVLCTYRSIYDKGEREDLEVKKNNECWGSVSKL